MRKYWLLVGLLLGILNLSLAQRSGCTLTLDQARQEFDKGHLYAIPDILKDCIKNGFDKSQRIEAYLLLARTHLLIDQPVEAEESYLNLLKLDPEYDLDLEKDPVDIIYLDEKFTTTPIFILFGKIGLNSSNAVKIDSYGVDNNLSPNENYKSLIGFNIGGGSELNISDNFSLGLELNFSLKSYQYSNILFEGDDQSLIEKQSSLEAPLFLKYRAHFNKLHPFIYVGYSYQYLLSSTAEVTLTDKFITGEGNVSEFSITGPSENLRQLRNAINSNVLVGFGMNYRYKYNYFFIDARYQIGMSNFVNEKEQYSNPTLLYKYGYVDDFKRLNSFILNFGYIYPLYKPRKIVKKQNIFRRVFK